MIQKDYKDIGQHGANHPRAAKAAEPGFSTRIKLPRIKLASKFHASRRLKSTTLVRPKRPL